MTAKNPVNLLIDSILTLFYPQPCDVCGGNVESRSDGVACDLCWGKTRIFDEGDALCDKCGEPVNAGVGRALRCGRCNAHHFDYARACGIYENALRASVLRLKRHPDIGTRAAAILANTSSRHPIADADLMIAVPLHADRLRERGYNQAEILCQILEKQTGRKFFQGVILRSRHSERHRAGMDALSRQKSVKGVFEVKKPRLITGKKVLLIDDVLTTGATASECASVLKEAGASAVYVLTLARPERVSNAGLEYSR